MLKVFKLAAILGSLQVSLGKIKHVALFGDSFTEVGYRRSRSHSISNGTVIGKDYQEVYPPTDSAADGGFQWPFYLGLYGGFKIWNYAVGGAVCNYYNSGLASSPVPDVLYGQTAWFVQDHVIGNNTHNPTLDIPPDETMAILWVGTNDVGIYNFITSGELHNMSFPDVADCQMQTLEKLHSVGVRNFIVMSMIPLQITGLYRNASDPIIYWPWVHDGNVWNQGAYNAPRTINRLVQDGITSLQQKWSDSKIEYFNTYDFFFELYDNPTKYFNGSIPANVTGHCHQCPNATDWHYCGDGDCTLDQRDSYMWWDELHPSEQTGRNIAKEMLKKILGTSLF
ncbi:hypothetical protein DL93DRAFT_2169916 [Clavulina sp. PMI_390]|nr:hypothetical protein DL93DRAFT_2169916 [Clavulina sp. PMI_390]